MIVVDSSGWLECFAEGPNAAFFASPIDDAATLVVPMIGLYEVYKRVLRKRDEALAQQVASAMFVGRVVDLSDDIALLAARLSVEHGLSLAGSIILATARHHRAVLWTQDADFVGLEDVQNVARA